MKSKISILMATSTLVLLSACVGSSSDGSSGTPPIVPSYETLDSTAEKTSTLGGVAIRSNGSSGALDVATTSGTTTHNTGNTTITDGTYSLTDSDGFNGGDTLSDGASTITVAEDITGTYEYVTAYDQTYASGGTTYDSKGVGGVITSETDVPTTGNATYSGGSSASIITATQGFDLVGGTSNVKADFAAGTVDATMTGFTATDQATGNAATAPIDTISATGMTIAGNRFSGGTVATTNSGAAVDVTGANKTTSAQGAFFGYDASNSIPDEVGGVVLQKGDDGIVAGGFIAD